MKDKLIGKEASGAQRIQGRCIWMTAGIISFKLCPFDYDCEHCDFDEVMRHQLKRRVSHKQKTHAENKSAADAMSNYVDTFFTFSVSELPDEYFIHLAHVWIRPQENHKWQIGIDQLLSYILPPPIGIELYNKKSALIQNEVLGKIITTVGAIFLINPLSGVFVSANPILAKHPELLQKEPLGRGWLAQIKCSQDSSELREFYCSSEAKRFMQEEACHLRHVLKYKGIEVNRAIKTLTNGGSNIKYLHQILSGKTCLELSRVLISLGETSW